MELGPAAFRVEELRPADVIPLMLGALPKRGRIRPCGEELHDQAELSATRALDLIECSFIDSSSSPPLSSRSAARAVARRSTSMTAPRTPPRMTPLPVCSSTVLARAAAHAVRSIRVDYERRCGNSEIILACRTRADATHCIDSPAFDCYQRSGAEGKAEVFITPYMYNDWDDARFTRCSSELSAKSMLLINTACPPP